MIEELRKKVVPGVTSLDKIEPYDSWARSNRRLWEETFPPTQPRLLVSVV